MHILPTSIVALTTGARRKPAALRLTPVAEDLTALAGYLDVTAVSKLSFVAQLIPEGRADWRLEGMIGATVSQPCVITLAPVRTRIEEPVLRRYLADVPPQGPGEIEMPEDDTVEPLPATIDLWQIAAEALALALPPWPRAPGAELGALVVAPPGVPPLTDERARPLAGLAALRGKLGLPEDDEV